MSDEADTVETEAQPESMALKQGSTEGLMDRCHGHARLVGAIKKLEAELKALKAQRDDERIALAGRFIDEGVRSLKTVDGQTLYLKRDLFLHKRPGIEMEEAVAALRQCGLHDFVQETYSASQLKAYVREIDERLQEHSPGALVEDELKELSRNFIIGHRDSVAVRGVRVQN